MKRLFIALRFTPEILTRMKTSLNKIKRMSDERGLEARWSPLENLHVTLLFLGNTEEETIPKILENLRSVAKKKEHFTIRLEGVGAFPDPTEARALWLGVRQSRDLMELQSSIAEILGRPITEYRPHITIARFRNLKNLWNLVKPFAREKWGKTLVDEIVLFESILAGPIPIYKALESVKLTEPSVALPDDHE